MVHQPLFPSLSVGLGASVIAHVGLLLAVSRGPAAAHPVDSADRADSRVEIEVAEPLEAQIAEPLAAAARPAVRSSRFQHHRHLYPVPDDHDAVPHDARVEHLRAAAARPAEVSGAAAAEAPDPAREAALPAPRFVLSAISRPRALVSPTVAGAAMASRPVEAFTPGDAGGPGHGGADDGGEGTDGVIAESRVTERALLLSSAPATYPLAARQREVEADVPLEIVVDTAGRVTSSRALGQSGYGLEEAALAAMVRYRFSPALRNGHPVRVRMRWVVQFRLH